jgi:hypothetical protein
MDELHTSNKKDLIVSIYIHGSGEDFVPYISIPLEIKRKSMDG